jgi:hypothetical protein
MDWFTINRISTAIDCLQRYNRWLIDPESHVKEYRPDRDLAEAQKIIASVQHQTKG